MCVLATGKCKGHDFLVVSGLQDLKVGISQRRLSSTLFANIVREMSSMMRDVPWSSSDKYLTSHCYTVTRKRNYNFPQCKIWHTWLLVLPQLTLSTLSNGVNRVYRGGNRLSKDTKQYQFHQVVLELWPHTCCSDFAVPVFMLEVERFVQGDQKEVL